jgi:hypothetical protein
LAVLDEGVRKTGDPKNWTARDELEAGRVF